MASAEQRNVYLDQVVAQSSVVEEGLRAKRAAPQAQAPGGGGGRRQEDKDGAAPAVDVRVTGWWRWKTVLVPPNAWIVHTRRGHSAPLHMGLGLSFRYNPAKDAYLVVPGTMQTILLNAFCICRELQGVMVQAYVQWIVEDIETAYRKLDFADATDPMRVVTLQLKEQAEAAIKDKVATMSVLEVVSDKQPIIEELTARLRDVAESALGLRIVTVQIKEAVVSSTRLWENLQKPYRAEQSQIARLAEVASEEAISTRERAAERLGATQRLDNESELSTLQGRNERQLADRQHETLLHSLNLEQERHAQETEIQQLRIELEQKMERLRLDYELATSAARADSENSVKLLEIERSRMRQEIANGQSMGALQSKLIDRLPDIVSRLPKPNELKSINLTGSDGTSLAGIIAELTTVVNAIRGGNS